MESYCVATFLLLSHTHKATPNNELLKHFKMSRMCKYLQIFFKMIFALNVPVLFSFSLTGLMYLLSIDPSSDLKGNTAYF